MGVYYHFYAIPPGGGSAPPPRWSAEDGEWEEEEGPDLDDIAAESITLDKPFGHVHEWVWGHKEPEWADLRLAILGPPGQEQEEEAFLTPTQAARAAEALQRVTRGMLEEQVRKETDDEESLKIVLNDFATLREFYGKAAQNAHAVFIHTG